MIGCIRETQEVPDFFTRYDAAAKAYERMLDNDMR
jgi:hypothetical protein